MLKEIYLKLFFNRPECWHPKIIPTSIGNFCPDCGKEIFITWLVLRCQCCSTKRQAKPFLKSAIPTEKYCSKCGTKRYLIEKHYKLELYDLHFAVLNKEEANTNFNFQKQTQVWVENENAWTRYIRPKLIPLLTR